MNGTRNGSEIYCGEKGKEMLTHQNTAQGQCNHNNQQEQVQHLLKDTLRRISSPKEILQPGTVHPVVQKKQHQHQCSRNLVEHFSDKRICHQCRQQNHHARIYDSPLRFHVRNPVLPATCQRISALYPDFSERRCRLQPGLFLPCSPDKPQQVSGQSR